MRQYVVYAMLVIFPISLATWFFWLLGKSFVEMYQDWRLERELGELREQSASHREERERVNTARLDNGCEHDFETGGHGLPLNACRKCGLEKQKPNGACDHVWKSIAGSTPKSVCEKCGRAYSPSIEPQNKS